MGPITSLRDFWSAIWRRRVLVVLVTLLGLPLAYFHAASQPRTFEATAVIQIEAPQVAATVTGEGSAAATAAALNAELDRINQTLFARGTVLALIERFGLFAALPSETQRVGLTRAAISTRKIVDPARAYDPSARPTGLSITVRLDDPEAAAALANALMDGIIADATREASERAGATLDFLVAEEARVSEAITVIEEQIATFRSTNIDSLPESVGGQRTRLTSLQESSLALEREIVQFEPGTGRLRPEEAERQRTLLEEQHELIEAAIDETEAALALAPTVERELGALTRRLSGLEAELTVITSRRTEAAVSQQLQNEAQAGGLSTLERAVVPEFAVSADRRQTAIMGAGAVGFAAVALAVLLEVLRPTIRTAAQMERLLGIEPLIVVPRVAPRHRVRRLAALVLALAALVGLLATAPGQRALREVAMQAGFLTDDDPGA